MQDAPADASSPTVTAPMQDAPSEDIGDEAANAFYRSVGVGRQGMTLKLVDVTKEPVLCAERDAEARLAADSASKNGTPKVARDERVAGTPKVKVGKKEKCVIPSAPKPKTHPTTKVQNPQKKDGRSIQEAYNANQNLKQLQGPEERAPPTRSSRCRVLVKYLE